jgi:hypothetical protein
MKYVSLGKFLLLSLFPLSGWSQTSSLPPCPQMQRFHNCFGEYTYPSGAKYIGEWREGKHHGMGAYFWRIGDKYIGEWQYGNMHGLGIYVEANGPKYIGERQYDKAHGLGIQIDYNGARFFGEWRQGVLEYPLTPRPSSKK